MYTQELRDQISIRKSSFKSKEALFIEVSAATFTALLQCFRLQSEDCVSFCSVCPSSGIRLNTYLQCAQTVGFIPTVMAHMIFQNSCFLGDIVCLPFPHFSSSGEDDAEALLSHCQASYQLLSFFVVVFFKITIEEQLKVP